MYQKVINELWFMDLFRRRFSLNVGTQRFSSTCLGLSFSLFIYSFLIYGFFVSNMFLRTNPTVLNQEVAQEKRTFLKIDVPMPFVCADENAQSFIRPDIFSFYAEYSILKTNSQNKSGKSVEYYSEKKLHACSEEDFKDYGDVYKRLGLNNTYCMDNREFELFGFWDEERVAQLKIQIRRCDNLTSNNTCASDEEIDSFLKRKLFGIYFPDISFDMNDYEEPLKVNWRVEYNFLDINLMKGFNIYLKRIEFVDDRSYLYRSQDSVEINAYDYKETDFFLENRTKVLFETYFFASRNIQKITRKYQKADEIFGSLGGAASLLMIIGYFVTSVENILNLMIIIINQLYSFDNMKPTQQSMLEPPSPTNLQSEELYTESGAHNLNESINEKPPNLQLSIDNKLFQMQTQEDYKLNNDKLPQKIIPPENIELVLDSIIEKEDLKPSIKNIKEDFQRGGGSEKDIKTAKKDDLVVTKKRLNLRKSKFALNFKSLKFLLQSSSTISFNLIHYFKIKIFSFINKKLSDEEQLFLKAEKLYNKEIDVINILKRLQELEKIKYILFDQEQIGLISIISKPYIFLSESGLKNSIYSSYILNYSNSIQNNSTKSGLIKKEDEDGNNPEFSKALNYYARLKSKRDLSEIDVRLLGMVEKKISELKMNKVV